eukprot:g14584.t1
MKQQLEVKARAPKPQNSEFASRPCHWTAFVNINLRIPGEKDNAGEIVRQATMSKSDALVDRAQSLWREMNLSAPSSTRLRPFLPMLCSRSVGIEILLLQFTLVLFEMFGKAGDDIVKLRYGKQGNGWHNVISNKNPVQSRFTAPDLPRLEILVPIYRALC